MFKYKTVMFKDYYGNVGVNELAHVKRVFITYNSKDSG